MFNSQNTKKKILFVNRPSCFTQRGGDTVVMENLCSYLQSKGFVVDFDLTCEKDFKQYDLIHIFNFATPDFSTKAGMKAKSCDVPFVVTTLFEDVSSFHNQSHAISNFLIQYQSLNQDKDFYNKNFFNAQNVIPSKSFNVQWLCDNASALITCGDNEIENIKRVYNAKSPMYTAHFGINVKGTGNAERFYNKYRIKDFIFSVGRLETRKNQLMMLKALEDSELPLVIAAGGFSYQPDYEKAVKLFKRKGQTIILGKLDQEDLEDAYSACRVHCLPSFYELPGLVSLEAAYYGANIVATDTGTTRNYLKDYAFYCSPYSPETILEAVNKAYNSPRNEGLINLAKSYTWDRYANETINIYEKVWQNMNTFQNQNQQQSVNNSNQEFKYDQSDFDLKIQEAQQLAQDKNFEDALSILYTLESSGCHTLSLYRSIGAVELARNDVSKAKEYFTKAIMIDNRDVKTLSGIGICAMRNGDYDCAKRSFINALNEDPYQIVTILQLMECAYITNDFLDAKDAIKNFIIKYPENIDMQFSYAGILLKLGELDEAESTLKIVEEKMPFYTGIEAMKEKIIEAKNSQSQNSYQPQNNFSDTNSIKNQKTEILQSDNEISFGDRNIEFDSIDQQIASIYEAKKRKEYDVYDNLINELMQNSSLNAEHRETVNILKAESLMLHGDNNSAMEVLEQVISKNPDSFKAICNIGIVFATAGNWDTAKKYFEKAIAINPNYDVAISGLGLCYANYNQPEDAFSCYYKAAKINPENKRAVLGVIEFAYKLSHLDELEEILSNYLEFHPADLDFIYSLSACYYAKKEYDKALELISKIFIFDPSYQNAIELKQMIEEKQASCNSGMQA